MPNGKSVKMDQMCEDIKSGETNKRKLFEDYGATYLRSYKAVGHAMELMKKPKAYKRTVAPDNCVWFGKAGQGKTWDAEQYAIDREMSMFKIPMKQLKAGWYNGYEGEEILLFDDFRGTAMEPHEFLNLLDGIPRLPIKGDFVENKATHLFFTSATHPINWWPNWYAKDDNNWAQVERRLKKINVVQNYVVAETMKSDYAMYKDVIQDYQPTFLQ